MTTPKLTGRQTEILWLVAQGCDTEEIAETLGIGIWTLRDHIRRLREKLGAKSMRDLPACARAAGIALPALDERA